MKKFVKPLVIAASVAAVAGIGAVSFAKWEAGSDNAKTVNNNSTGAVSVLKFGEGTISPITDLKPLDQDGTITAANYTEVKFKVATSEGYDKTDFKLKVTISGLAAGVCDGTNEGVYAASTAPTALSTGTALSGTATELTYTLDASADHEYSVYVWLQSGDMADMNKTFTLTYELVDGTTSA